MISTNENKVEVKSAPSLATRNGERQTDELADWPFDDFDFDFDEDFGGHREEQKW